MTDAPGPPAAGDPSEATYGEFYYGHCFAELGSVPYERTEHWLGFFGYMADRIVSDLGPATVLDAGCAMGFLVESLRDRGVDAYGLDVSDYALGRVREDIRPYCFNASITEPLPRRYDLITCIETLEHLPPVDAERAVANICRHTDDVIFSSTPTHFKETSHLNVRPVEYWAELFAREGLYRDTMYDPDTYIAPWSARYRRRSEPAARIVAEYDRALFRARTESRELRELAGERQAALVDALRAKEAAEANLAAITSTTSYLVSQRVAAPIRRAVPGTGSVVRAVRHLLKRGA